MRILIVEDEPRLADALGQIMREQKYLVDVVRDGQDGYDYAAAGGYDAVVLDVMLPRRSGFDVARALRRAGVATPILMLTARAEISDRVSGLDCGADDYMTKPFAPEELLARVRALTRRQGGVVFEELRCGDAALSLSTYDLSCAGRSVRLGFKEFEVMRILMSSPGSLVPKETLLTKVWGMESGAEDNNVEAYISFLRKKLLFLGAHLAIHTQRKVGYRLEVTADD